MIKIQNRPYNTLSTAVHSKINSGTVESSLNNVLKRTDLGYLQLTARTSLWDSAQELGKQLQSQFTNYVLIGFGGSSMGARALAEITHTDSILFFDNVDFIEIESQLKKINDLNKTAWIFASKSGNTIEVLTIIDFLHQHLTSKKIDLWKNSFYITEQKQSPLFDLAKKHDRPCLEIPLDVGGRFSVLSPVGLLMASLCGLDLSQLKAGAELALKDKQTMVDLSTQYLSSFEDGKNITLFWFYNSATRWLGGWIQQLWAESLGKTHNRKNGPAHFFSTPVIAIGSSDQHSILQQVMDGQKNKLVTFFRFNHIEKQGPVLTNTLFSETAPLKNKNVGELIKAQAKGTADALTENQVPQMTLLMEDLSAKSLGYFFMTFQLVVSVLAEYHDVNAFDQPGVQLGKLKTIDELNK